ncbi:MAG: TonB-dependent receptor, partial [Acidobacteria bacterium]|nr:TonB-dependent receptor [Acidobacteriota bacterium]
GPIVADVQLQLSAITDTVVVSASYVDTPRSEAAAEVTAFTRQDIETRQFTTVAEALQFVPGMSVAATGGAGSVTSLFSRGGESDYTLVLLDGIKLNSFGGGFDFGHLTTFGLAQVEVVRGPQSAVYGSDAIGGVVQMRTRIGGRPAASGLMEVGGYGTTRLAAGTTGTRGPVAWGLSLDQVRSKGWTDVAPGTADRVTNDDYRASAIAAAADWRLNARATLRVDGRFGSNERGNPGPFGSNPIGAFGGIDTVSRGTNDFGMAAVSFTHEWSPALTLRARTDYADVRSSFVSPWGDSQARSRRWTARGQIDRSFNRVVSATVGAAIDGERANSTYITGATSEAIPVTRTNAGYFGEVRLRSASRLFVTAGLRAEHIVRGAIEPDPWAWEPRPTLPADRVWSVNPRGAVSYYVRTSDESAGNWTRAHASAGTGIRPPDAFEIAFTDNPALKPERSRSIDGGAEQSLAGGLFVVDATAFLNHYDDLIVAVGRSLQDYSRYRTDNISNARARGLETSAAIRTRGGLDVRVSYTFLDTEVLGVDGGQAVAPPPFAPGDWLVRRPRHQASVDVTWSRRAVTAFARAGGRSRVLDVEPNWGASGGLFQTPGFAVADAGVAFHVGRRIDVQTRVNNLFDCQYESVLGYPAPRRSFTVGVRLAASR